MYQPRKFTAFEGLRQLLLVILGVILAAVMGSWMADKAHASNGCVSAWQAPRSVGAQACRSQGWTVFGHLVEDPGHHLRYENLPSCLYDDGSRLTRRCIWYGHRDGNQIGRTFWVGVHGGIHYVRVNRP